MAETRNISINFQGKEVKLEQLISYQGQHGETVYDLKRKNCTVILNSTGEKNVVAITDQHGKINWLGTFSNDIKIKSVDLVQFKDGYMSKFNCASVVDTTGIRYEIPAFNYFEQELISEEADEVIEVEITAEPVEVSEPIIAEPVGTIADSTEPVSVLVENKEAPTEEIAENEVDW